MYSLEAFEALGLSAEALDAIRAKGFETPSPIQKLTIPALLDTSKTGDLIAQAQTGTGKTAAFGLPMIERLERGGDGVQALVLVPTRELALQVNEELLSFNGHKKLSIAAIYGGASISEQLRRLSRGVDIVVGTPGRVLDHIRRGTLKLDALKLLVLDEADEMLNMGFIDDIEEILASAHEDRRILLFSATMPNRILTLSQRYMRDPELLKVESTAQTTDLTDQIYFEVRESDKFDALTRIVDVESEFYGIVFSRTKVGVDDLVQRLSQRGYSVDGLHGDISQGQREKILKKFKSKSINILIATDVAARGIDINNLTHVINYSLPQDTESYVHRIGRTGRAGNSGTAITFISPSEFRQFSALRREVKSDIKKVEIPSAQDIVTMKRGRIKEDLQEIIAAETFAEYVEIAEGLLQEQDPEIMMAALLRLAFKNELEESNYPEIRSINVDRRGTARLFLSIGRYDGYDPRKLVQLLKRECGLSDSHIDRIEIRDSYSFVTVPFTEAQTIIKKLNTLSESGKPIAEIAQPGTDEGQRGGGRSGRGGGGRKPFPRKDGKGYGKDNKGFGRDDRRGGSSAPRRGAKNEGGWREDFDTLFERASGQWGGKNSYRKDERSGGGRKGPDRSKGKKGKRS